MNRHTIKLSTAALFSAWLAPYAITTYAQETGTVGGNAGVAPYNLPCPGDRRITGVQVRHNNDVIDRARFRCTRISNAGDWTGTHLWTAFTPSSSPKPADRTSTATCPANHFVRGFTGFTKRIATGPVVISRLSIACVQSNNAHAVAANTSQTRTTGGSSQGGAWSTWRNCPNNGLAQSARGRTGWHLDNLALGCTNPQAPPLPAMRMIPGIAAQPAAPAAGPSFQSTLEATFRHARCVNCHGFFDNGIKDQLTAGVNHSGMTTAIDCASCHTEAIVGDGATGTFRWHAPQGLSLQDMSTLDLCQLRARRSAGGRNPQQHMTQDPLIRWAVNSGQVPMGKPAKPTAPPNSASAWNQRVNDWWNNGNPACP